jgi:hypothetical protein
LFAAAAAGLANAFGHQWSALWLMVWLVYPLQAAAIIMAIVALRRNREENSHAEPSPTDSPS